MRPSSKTLANRIDVMIAFQNGEDIQYRHKTGMQKWQNSPSQNLMFNFDVCEYRKKPVMIEGWCDPRHIHTGRQGGCQIVGCIQVRQVAGE